MSSSHDEIPFELVTQETVKAANRLFYDTLGDSYEHLDGRRSLSLEAWLRAKLHGLQRLNSACSLLDLGTGSGLVTRCAQGLFETRIGMDLSSRILAASSTAFDLGVAADIDHLPFCANSFDTITSFAVLHHLYDCENLLTEVSRVLKPGGVFYSDHDLDAAFAKWFHLPIAIYRKLLDPAGKYSRATGIITRELYSLTEWHDMGVDSSHIAELFRKAGFSVETNFHWFGLTPLTDRIFGTSAYPFRCSPLFSITARKP